MDFFFGKLYGLERNCMVSNHESYGLGRVWGRQVCPEKSGTGTCTLRMHIHVESVKQSFSIMIFVPVVEHAPTLTVCLRLTNFKEPIRQKDLWNFWFDKSLRKLSWVLHKIHTWNCELHCFISYYPSLVSKCKKYSAYMVKFMNDCLMENHGFEIHLMTFCERTTQQLIELDAFTVVIKHDTVETNINMFNNGYLTIDSKHLENKRDFEPQVWDFTLPPGDSILGDPWSPRDSKMLAPKSNPASAPNH